MKLLLLTAFLATLSLLSSIPCCSGLIKTANNRCDLPGCITPDNNPTAEHKSASSPSLASAAPPL